MNKILVASYLLAHLLLTNIFAGEGGSPEFTGLKLIENSADSLFRNAKYYDAVTEYKRLLFFDPDKKNHVKYLVNIGDSYSFGKFYHKSLAYYNKALDLQIETSIETDISYRIYAVLLKIGDFTAAENLIADLEKKTVYGPAMDSLYYWRGWGNIYQYKWFEAAKEFNKISPGHELSRYCRGVNESLLSVELVKIMSFIIPGSGQIYSGNYFSGIASFGWTALWGYNMIDAFAENRIFDGLVIGDLLFLRFYRGNIQNAGRFAEEKNLNISENALLYLLSNYEGIKP
ncbi:MAG: hypothetical protein K9I69_00445 [Ignavibacteriales bacterium]|nr:hypothetical protein [Ignavibacteriales bacterium]MCF8305772.1 hypothetical protein [Ignavibacteriales bacterium]MCF8315494.1 hypothetical protein [Ignavibacteriales bacterium]MCF8436977.1 hypothetical protein [Ignavibacteriales bacterium]